MNTTFTIRCSIISLLAILFLHNYVFSQTLADRVRIEDTRSVATTPSTYYKNIIPSFKTSSVIGLPTTGYGFTTVLGFWGWGDYTGGKAHEMGFLDNGRVYVRSGANFWENWRRFIVEDVNGSVGDLNSTLLQLMPLNVSSASTTPSGIEMTSNTGYWDHQTRAYIGLQKRSMNTAGTNNDINDKVGIWLRGIYTEHGGSVPIYLGGNTSGNASMLIESDGRVAIGTMSTTAGYKLFVEEGIRTRKVKVDQTTWADYVFNEDYQLPTLKQLERYIKQNKHLPEVPSADEVAKNGIDLGDNQVLLLKKIEELTLYIIDQEKQMDLQNKKLQEITDIVAKLKTELDDLKQKSRN